MLQTAQKVDRVLGGNISAASGTLFIKKHNEEACEVLLPVTRLLLVNY